jgi:hypothetical protein
MLSRLHQIASRRRFLQFLTASPLLAHERCRPSRKERHRMADPLTWRRAT